MNHHNGIEIVDLLIKKQYLLTDLYQLFAESYPDYEEFWTEACQQEREHAEWLESFRVMMKEGNVCYCQEKTNTYAIETFIKHIENTIFRFNKQPFVLKRALAVAMDVERSMIKQKSFDRFDGYSRSVGKLLEVIRENKRLSAIKMEAAQIYQRKVPESQPVPFTRH